MKDETRDKTTERKPWSILEGFAIGADDYVTKPFHMEELVARINAVCHRYAMAPAAASNEFRLGGFVFNAPRHTLTDRNGEERKLTSKESDLLLMLCECKGSTLERGQALQNIWKEESRTSARSMDVYITLASTICTGHIVFRLKV